MGSEEVIDIEGLLSPVSEEQPSGSPLRDGADASLSAKFYTIRDASQRARDLERQNRDYSYLSDEERENEPAPERADWHNVVTLATDILSNDSKDLWVAAWLTEALARTDGFAGLRDGFRLIRLLCESFWDTIHPRPDEDDGIEHTVSQLSSLNSTLITPIQAIPITPETRSYLKMSSIDYIDAVDVEKTSDPDRRAAKIDRGSTTLEMFDKAIAEASQDSLAEILADIRAANEEFAQLDSVLDDKCGVDESGYALAPASSSIREALEECQTRLEDLTRSVFQDESETSESPEGESDSTDGGQPVSATSSIGNRDAAFQQLLKVSDFFRRTEPHSPVSYALEQAVRWGKMSLPDLMTDLISDSSARREMFRRAGIPDADGYDDD